MSHFYSDDQQIIHLKCENELQLIVREPNDKVWLKLIEGSAEIFGSNLLVNKEYKFSYFSSLAVFSWTGCILNLRKEASDKTQFCIRASKQTLKMKQLHEKIEKTYLNAYATNIDFPRILVTGPTDAGKSTLCRFLLNYDVKIGRKPIFVDLDVGQSSLSITGTFGILHIHEQSDIYGKFNEQELATYYFGYKSPGHNMKLYKLLLQQVGLSLNNRLKWSETKGSGVLIDTCGWIDGGGYKLIKDIIENLKINIVVVLAKRSLYFKLMNDVSKETKLIFVNKFKEVSTRNQTVRKNNRDSSVHEYFYGLNGQLKPYKFEVSFKDLQIFKVDYSQSLNVASVTIEPIILYQVLALSYAENIEEIMHTSVYGFISIVELDMDSKVAMVLSPKPGPLPTNYFIIGDITFIPKEEFC